MIEIGFSDEGRYYKHPENQYIIEFLPGPLAIGDEPVIQVEEFKLSTGILQIISSTDCVKDRLAAYYHWGDTVEGRVAGALYDIFDITNEGYDSASFGFALLGDNVFQGLYEVSFYDFWEHWMWSGYNKHHTVRAIYQNTIDYDTGPVFNPLLPDLSAFENNPRQHVIELWSYSFDNESSDPYLTYEITYISDWRCGISLDGHWIDIAPEPYWLGSCDVTVQVSDSIKTMSDTFRVNVIEVVGISYMPIINLMSSK